MLSPPPRCTCPSLTTTFFSIVSYLHPQPSTLALVNTILTLTNHSLAFLNMFIIHVGIYEQLSLIASIFELYRIDSYSELLGPPTCSTFQVKDSFMLPCGAVAHHSVIIFSYYSNFKNDGKFFSHMRQICFF